MFVLPSDRPAAEAEPPPHGHRSFAGREKRLGTSQYEPQLRPSEAQSERANVIEEVNSEQSALKQQPAVDWGLAVERSSIALKQQAVAARASAWARTIEKLRERQMALKERGAPVMFDRRSPTQ